MRIRIVGALVVGVSVVAGCGAAEVTVHSQASQQAVRQPIEPVALEAPAHCSTDYVTLLTATEAYWALHTAYPQNQDALVADGLLRIVADDFELTAVGTSYSLIGVRDCATFEPDESSADPEPDPGSEQSTCDIDRRALEIAWEAYTADHGSPPESEADLVDAGLLNQESPGFDLIGSKIVAVPGVCA